MREENTLSRARAPIPQEPKSNLCEKENKKEKRRKTRENEKDEKKEKREKKRFSLSLLHSHQSLRRPYEKEKRPGISGDTENGRDNENLREKERFSVSP